MADKCVQVSGLMSAGWTGVGVFVVEACRARSGLVEFESVSFDVAGFSITFTITVFDVLKHPLDLVKGSVTAIALIGGEDVRHFMLQNNKPPENRN